MKNLFLLAIVFISMQTAAQKTKPIFQGQIQGGLLEGENGSAFQLQTINGIQYKTWSTGIGIGLDYYYIRSVPVFLNLQKNLGKSGKSPFLYAGGGYNFPWLRPQDREWNMQDEKGGLYFDAGVGYQLPVMKTSALFFSLGYSVKEYSIKSYNTVYIAIYPPPPPVLYTFDYTLKRLSVKTGLRF